MDIHRLQTRVFVQGDVQEQFARMQPLGGHVGVDTARMPVILFNDCSGFDDGDDDEDDHCFVNDNYCIFFDDDDDDDDDHQA